MTARQMKQSFTYPRLRDLPLSYRNRDASVDGMAVQRTLQCLITQLG